MAWIGESQGIFRLHESDQYCGSFISVEDTAEIFGVKIQSLSHLPMHQFEGSSYLSELDLHRRWSAGEIVSPFPPRIGNARVSFDELIIKRLLEITLPGCLAESQVGFGRKYVDLRVSFDGHVKLIEFVGPSHFIPQYQRPLISPLERKKAVEDHFGEECVIWPYWIQRCARNVLAVIGQDRDGLASVWSTKAFFGDFVYVDSAEIIVEISSRFGAVKSKGLGYMYGNSHTNKPVHPIMGKLKKGKISKDRLIPKGNRWSEAFWLPEDL